jgi:sigma-B regulation protein RsbU (phosphoserine phosphatase)
MSTDRLKRLASDLKKGEEIKEGLRMARRRQLHMLPSLPVVPGVEFAAVYDLAADISGDFYDVFAVNENLIGIALGDVSGHGVEAAIIMGMAKKALQIYAKGRESAADTLVVTNADLTNDLGGGTFVSASYGILNTREHAFHFARAGHNPALLVNTTRDPPLVVIKPNGMVIGADHTGKRFAAGIEEKTVALQSGDLVFQYTDGVVEAPDQKKDPFGEPRLHALLLKCAHLCAAEALNLIEDVVLSHIGTQAHEDDITMIAFKVL